MTQPVERLRLAPDFEISRVVTGLWQIADMERDGSTVDLDAAATAMEEYVAAGLTTFDMADHYGSAEEIAGRFRQTEDDDRIRLLTKWVPEPGGASREAVSTAWWVRMEPSRPRMSSRSCTFLRHQYSLRLRFSSAPSGP